MATLKSNAKVPVLGQPVFVITENPLEDKVSIVGERGFLNNLVYYAADAIMVKALAYADEQMTKVVINKGMHLEGDESKSLEIHMDLQRNTGRDNDSTTIFVDEFEAQAIARKLNENQKKNCKKLLDLATKAYNEYDVLISLCTVNTK